MGRPRSFDEDEVLDRAVEIFRRSGYSGTSLEDLESGLGIGRQSLYNVFGDKNALYQAALLRYRERTSTDFLAALRDPRPIRVVLREMLTGAASGDTGLQNDGWGCLVLNAALERSDDSACSVQVARNQQMMEKALAERLAKDQELGDLGAHHDPVALARFLFVVLLGIRIFARSAEDPRAVEDVVRHALAALG